MQARRSKQLLLVIYNHCSIMVEAVLLQENVKLNLYDNSWPKISFFHILKGTKCYRKLGDEH